MQRAPGFRRLLSGSTQLLRPEAERQRPGRKRTGLILAEARQLHGYDLSRFDLDRGCNLTGREAIPVAPIRGTPAAFDDPAPHDEAQRGLVLPGRRPQFTV